MPLFNFFNKKRPAVKGFQSQASQSQLKAFILEPILTPSGLIDLNTEIPALPDFADFTNDVYLANAFSETEIEFLDYIYSDQTTLSDNNFTFESGVFVIGDTGEVSIDFLFDGGGYEGEIAIFSLDGMENFEPGSETFVREAALRSLSNSPLGYVVIADSNEGAKFTGDLGGDNWNYGEYQGVKTFSMRPGDTFGIMLVPNGKVEQVAAGVLDADKLPLFSMATANPNDIFHVGQIADVTGDGNTFVLEDLRVDTGSDRDYNDIIFQIKGATAKAQLIDDFVDPVKDWRGTELGQDLITYAQIAQQETEAENAVLDLTDELLFSLETGFESTVSDGTVDYTKEVDNDFSILTTSLDESSIALVGDYNLSFQEFNITIEDATEQFTLEIDNEFTEIENFLNQINEELVANLDHTLSSNDIPNDTIEASPDTEFDTLLNELNQQIDNSLSEYLSDVPDAYDRVEQEIGDISPEIEVENILDLRDISLLKNWEDDINENPLHFQPLIGIIDTGFSSDNHQIDYSNIILGKDLVENDDNPFLEAGEGDGHGSLILGQIAAAQAISDLDGKQPKPKLWLGRAIGSGRWAESLLEFVDTVKLTGEQNALVNLSFDLTQVDAEGNITTRYELTAEERLALAYAQQNGILIVVSAGNQGQDISALGQASLEFDNIITVGAAAGLNKANYSSYGQGLDLLASGNNSGVASGTSIAAAEVTGAIAQVWAVNPELNYLQVIEIIKATARDLGASGWDEETGAGLLNLSAAIELAKITLPQPYTKPSDWVLRSWLQQNQVPKQFWSEVYELYNSLQILDQIGVTNWEGKPELKATERAAWGFGNPFQSIANSVSSSFNNVKNTASNTIKSVSNSATNTFNNFKGSASSAINNFTNKASKAVNSFKNTAASAVGNITNKLTNTFNNFKAKATNTFNNVSQKIASTVNNIKKTASNTINNFKNKVTTTASNIKKTAVNTYNNFKNTVSQSITSFKNTANSTLQNLKNKTTNTFNNFKNVAVNTTKNFVNKAASAVNKFKNSASQTFNNFSNSVSTNFNNLKNKSTEFYNNNKDAIHIALDVAGFIPVFGALADGANAGLYALEGDWVNAGLSLVAAIPGAGDLAAVAKGGKYLIKGGSKFLSKGGKILSNTGEMLSKGGKFAQSFVNKLNVGGKTSGLWNSIKSLPTNIRNFTNKAGSVIGKKIGDIKAGAKQMANQLDIFKNKLASSITKNLDSLQKSVQNLPSNFKNFVNKVADSPAGKWAKNNWKQASNSPTGKWIKDYWEKDLNRNPIKIFAKGPGGIAGDAISDLLNRRYKFPKLVADIIAKGPGGTLAESIEKLVKSKNGKETGVGWLLGRIADGTLAYGLEQAFKNLGLNTEEDLIKVLGDGANGGIGGAIGSLLSLALSKTFSDNGENNSNGKEISLIDEIKDIWNWKSSLPKGFDAAVGDTFKALLGRVLPNKENVQSIKEAENFNANKISEAFNQLNNKLSAWKKAQEQLKNHENATKQRIEETRQRREEEERRKHLEEEARRQRELEEQIRRQQQEQQQQHATNQPTGSTEFLGRYYVWESYTIKSGESLSAIAFRTMGNGSEPYYNFIANRNGIPNPHLILAGKTIEIPRQVSATTIPSSVPTSSTVYLSTSSGEIFQLNTLTGEKSHIYQGRTFTDLALSPDGKLYATDFDNLFEIDLITKQEKFIGRYSNMGSWGMNALAFSPNGKLYGAGAYSSNLFEISTQTAQTGFIGWLGGYSSSGDIVFNGNNEILGTVRGGNSDQLVSFNLLTGNPTTVANLGLTEVYGLATNNGTLAAFTSNGQQLSIDPNTGLVKFQGSIGASGQIWGMAGKP